MIGIVLEGLRGEQSRAQLCRREGIAANLGTALALPVFGIFEQPAIRATRRAATGFSDDQIDRISHGPAIIAVGPLVGDLTECLVSIVRRKGAFLSVPVR